MPAADMPAAEVTVTDEVVRALLRGQRPDLAELELTVLANGWDNVIYRLGDDLLVRLPRREVAVPLIETEQRWLPLLGPGLPLPVPTPVHAGRPGADYPWPWSIVPYQRGRTVLDLWESGSELADPLAAAERLGRFFVALHQPAPPDAPVNPYRGVPLSLRATITRTFLERLDHIPDLADRFAATTALPDWTGTDVWIHGDPHAGNVLTDGTAIIGVVDFGDMCGGDPATDLMSAWVFFDRAGRERFRDTVDADDGTWERACAWALGYGIAMVASSADNPPYSRMGHRILDAVRSDD